MSEYDDDREGTPSKIHVQSLPSDYSDVQPSTYDPDFISQISNKMQIPHKLGPTEEVRELYDNYSQMEDANIKAHEMTVPDRIIVAGEGQHIGAKENLTLFGLSDLPQPESVPYVGLMTPPRTLTLEEQSFPNMDIKEEETKQNFVQNDEKKSHNYNGSRFVFPDISSHDVDHGDDAAINERFGFLKEIKDHIESSPAAAWLRSAVQMQPYTPAVSMNESLLLNDEDDATLLKTQVAKLTRKVAVLEEENLRRSTYEKFVYPIVFGWSIWKLVSVFWSLMRPRHY